MGKKKIEPSSENVFDVIDSVTLTLRDKSVDEPCSIRLFADQYTRKNSKIIQPKSFKIELSGTVGNKKKKYIELMNKIIKFIKLSSIGNKTKHRAEIIMIIVAAFKKFPDAFDLSFKVVPVRGNKADYDLIYNFFDLKVEEI